MDPRKKIVLGMLALAALSGCATGGAGPRPDDASVAPAHATDADAEPRTVLRPAASYGSMGGYRYRRFVVVNVAHST